MHEDFALRIDAAFQGWIGGIKGSWIREQYDMKRSDRYTQTPDPIGVGCFVVVHSLSPVWLCDLMDCSTPGFPVLYFLWVFAQTHAHWVGDAIQPSHPSAVVNWELQNAQTRFRKGKGNQRSNCQHLLDHRESKRILKNIYFFFIGYAKGFDCGSQQTVENS